MTESLLTATPNESVTVEGVTPGTRGKHTAQTDDNGVVRDNQGRSYGDGPYRIVPDE